VLNTGDNFVVGLVVLLLIAAAIAGLWQLGRHLRERRAIRRASAPDKDE
jgi:hypothetical protein